jgi:Uma2 family endonuclease
MRTRLANPSIRSKPRGERTTISLTVPIPSSLGVSPRGFKRICALNRDLRLERTAKGELIVTPPAGSETGRINNDISARLWIWAKNDRNGESFDSSTGFTLPNGAVRSPDASWIRLDRWNALTPEQKRTFAPICPDFVVELRSPADDKKDLHEKMKEYISQGARLGWLIDPIARSVEIHRRDRAVEVLNDSESLSGEDVLPGFTLAMKGILFE